MAEVAMLLLFLFLLNVVTFVKVIILSSEITEVESRLSRKIKDSFVNTSTWRDAGDPVDIALYESIASMTYDERRELERALNFIRGGGATW